MPNWPKYWIEATFLNEFKFCQYLNLAFNNKSTANENNEGGTGNGTGALADVWRQAFGAVKPKKPVEASPLNNKLLIKQEIDTYRTFTI